jgi:transcriptional regulator with GAF, ATPase, and Fis domain
VQRGRRRHDRDRVAKAGLALDTLTLPPTPPADLPLQIRTNAGAVADVAAPMRIGSAPGNDLRVDDRFVSTRHAEIRREQGRLMIVDVGSKNGLWLGGTRVEACPIATGLVVRVGATLLEFVAAAPRTVDDDARPMLGRSAAFTTLLADLERVARVARPVLLRGETGTGKELAARHIHDHSPRRDRPFVAVNCAAIVEGLAESGLFGHVRGAFTGAVRAHAGAFASADGGTLFLDELGELPLALQAKLLRVLETGRVQPVGGDAELPVDVRVVAATHRDLDRMVAHGSFREDLYHRLGVLVLRMPPLRERAEDIPVLLDAFVRRVSEELGRCVELAPGCLQAAVHHGWPGNIRALHNAVVRAATMDDAPITAERLLASGIDAGPARALVPPPALTTVPAASPDGSTSANDGHRPPTLTVPRGDWAAIEGEVLRTFVAEHGSIRRAALALGVPRSTLGARLRRRSSGRG